LTAVKKALSAAKGSDKICQFVEQTECKSTEHLLKLMDEVLGEKGEGVMIKNPACSYEKKRSRALLKVKKFEDTEAVVVGI